jgi:AraC family transcriptional activator of pobA
MAAAPGPTRLPAYRLYGEVGGATLHELPDLLHLETIAARSRVHDWEIRPHRHEALFQILVIRAGRVQAQLDGRRETQRGPCAITVPALAAHGFRFSRRIDGVVITLAQAQLLALIGDDRRWRETLLRLRVIAPASAALCHAAGVLRDEYGGQDPWRAAALVTAARQVLLEAARCAPPAVLSEPSAAGSRALQHVQRLQALVERQFRRQPPMAELAATLGITPTQLNRVCGQVLGHPALAVLHQRLLLEAQRELGYTTMGIKQVAIGLGFADPGYFTRFFRRLTGLTPTAWRQRAREPASGSASGSAPEPVLNPVRV